jgi:protein tyrosine phosphatase (PTP) superfamily phosphohydrolase (DUF442 family)
VQKAVSRPFGLALAALFAASLGAAPVLAAPVTPRPETWATPLGDTAVANCYRVEPDFYRSAQPTAEGFRKLASLGVKTVLDVAGGDGDTEAAEGTGIKLLHIPMSAFGLRDDRVLQALRILADPANRPVVIHCQQGADRTGALVALYRVVVQGWTKEEAIREMNEGGYHHSSLFVNLDRYVERADVAALRKALGIAATPVLATAQKAAAPAVSVSDGSSAAPPVAAPLAASAPSNSDAQSPAPAVVSAPH